MVRKRPSRLDLARTFADGNHAPTTKTTSFFASMCIPVKSRKLPLRSLNNSVHVRKDHSATSRSSQAGTHSEKDAGSHRTRATSHSTTTSRSPVDSAFSENDLVWPGNGCSPRTYPGLDKEDELWSADGDCLVYFEEPHRGSSPMPYFRVHSSAIRRADLAFLNQLLNVGRCRRRSSQASALQQHLPKTTPEFPNAHRLSIPGKQLRRSSVVLDATSPRLSKTLPPLKIPEFVPRTDNAPITAQTTYNTPGSRFQETFKNTPITPTLPTAYEIWFAVPAQMSSAQRYKHKLAIRNLLAILHNKSIVGNDVMEAIGEAQELVTVFSSSKGFLSNSARRLSWTESRPNTDRNMIPAYVRDFGFDDIRHNLPQALKLLAWTELPSVRWSSGYTETFAHVAGMMSTRTLQSPSFKRLSEASRYNLQMASETINLTTMEADEKLRRFNLSQIWTMQKIGSCGPRASSDALSRFLTDFYTVEFGAWPPSSAHGSNQKWLTRSIVQRLQVDFGAIYEYLVDHDVEWDKSSSPNTRTPRMVHISKSRFSPNETLPLTSMLAGFDNFHGLNHIPYAYPLLPATMSSASRRRLSQTFVRRGSGTSIYVKETSMMFTRASNLNSLRHHVESNKLLQSFRQHEASNFIEGVTPQEARLGRWILLYGVLQVLSLLSVDISGLRHTAGVDYFLCASLQGCPPWKDAVLPTSFTEASPERSYCFEAPEFWPKRSKNRKDSMTATSPDEDQLTALSQLHLGSVVTGTDWGNSNLSAYSPISEGAAMMMPMQYGFKGKLTEVHCGRSVVI